MRITARKGKLAARSKHCNCKNSKCLKLYCECFASGRYCDDCNCLNCFNNHENEAVRQQAVEGILERNPNAFRPKIQTADGEATRASDGVRHCKGCNCKKSGCLKKYCECFQGGIFCSEICRCLDCKNYEGSDARDTVMRQLGPHGPQAAAQPAGAAAKRPRLGAPPPTPGALPSPGALPPPGALPLLLPMGGAGGAGLQPLSLGTPLSGLLLPQAAPQLFPRSAAYSVVHEALSDEVVSEMGRLLLLVANEEGERFDASTAAGAGGEGLEEQQEQRQAQGQQQQGEEQEQEQQQPPAMDIRAALAAAQAAVQAADAGGGAAAAAAAGAAAAGSSGDGAAAAAAAPAPRHGAAGGSRRYAAQEAAVLSEFGSVLRSVIATLEKKVPARELAAAAAAAAAAGGTPDAAGGAAAGPSPGGAAALAGLAPAQPLPLHALQALLAGVPGAMPAGLPGGLGPQLSIAPLAGLPSGALAPGAAEPTADPAAPGALAQPLLIGGTH
ncbi:hypothetical protein Rsub_10152 [Raphidocelis subcapitata]|uniref:CRC domain-containing protein n=1 Tax=Raphidocelis subcapitata TaxID=307507 RepID=A0A2V0PCH6_9CHLO|nr:hypothetical protein Rsub_10152 [Raphidocelis subcapitata]|eukprot:GBF97551.1 hypothetical protein Rsub_10152 [Raphidocelis subcapitata]